VLAALVCHSCFTWLPGLLGQKTGLPLYIVGTSTFGAQADLSCRVLDGCAAFGWVGVNVFFRRRRWRWSSRWMRGSSWWCGSAGGFAGLKGIQYVARVATYLPLIPLAILIILLTKTAGTIGDFDAQKFVALHQGLSPQAPGA